MRTRGRIGRGLLATLLIGAALAAPAGAGATPTPNPVPQDGPTTGPPSASDPAQTTPATKPDPGLSPQPGLSPSPSDPSATTPAPATTTPNPYPSGDEPSTPGAATPDTSRGSPNSGSNEPSGGDVEPVQITSPLCENDDDDPTMALKPGSTAQRNCRWSGSVAQPHPIASYGLDQHVSASVAHPDTVLPSMLQSVCQLVWIVLLYLIRGVLLLLEIGFSNDLIHSSMGAISGGLNRLRDLFNGESWQLAALSILGLWAIWTGLVRRKTIHTFGGLAAAIALMIGAQVIMLQPGATVGHVATLSSDGALAALSAVSTASVQHPADSFAQADQQLFDTLVVHPWCTLQFADPEGCLAQQEVPGQPKTSIADVWLSYPANSPERDVLYDHPDGKPFNLKVTPKQCKLHGVAKWLDSISSDDSLWKKWDNFVAWACKKVHSSGPGRRISLKYNDAAAHLHTDASIQGRDGVFTRLALLGMIATGLAGAICVLFWVGIRLLLAGLFALVLLLFTPIVFLLAAFGDAGRRSVLAWAQRLLGVLVAKFVFAVMLAVLVLVDLTITQLHMSWLALWMLQIAYWWGVFFRRGELLGFLTFDRRSTEGGLGLGTAGKGPSLNSIYYGWRMARDGLRQVTAPARATYNAGRRHAAGSAARAVDRANEREEERTEGIDAVATRDREERTAETTAIRNRDRGALGDEARGARQLQHEVRRRRTDAQLTQTRQRQAVVDGALRGPGAPPLSPATEAQLTEEERQLTARERHLRNDVERLRADPDTALGGRELDAYIQQRTDDVQRQPADHDRNLIAAGIDPDAFRGASAADQDRMRDQSTAAMERSQALITGAATTDPMRRDELERAWQRIRSDGDEPETRVRATRELEVVSRGGATRRAERDREEARHARQHERQRRRQRPQDDRWAQSRRRVR